jgi:purine-nucleoside phosphorylase
MNQNQLIITLKEAVTYINQITGQSKLDIGIIMGTGLEAMASKMSIEHTIPYHQIPGFPVSTVSFHKGNLLIGKIGNRSIFAMQGRFHFYEGYSSAEVSFPVRVMAALGVRYLLVSNAAGGLNLQYKKGDIMAICDHINLLPDNPLRGLHDPSLGERFVDMSCPYSEELVNELITLATAAQLHIHKGVYVAVQGPNLETKAEYRWLRSLPADAVGMSTVPEIIVANQLKMHCIAVSVITDECDPDNLKPINIAEIISVAQKADAQLSDLFVQLINTI